MQITFFSCTIQSSVHQKRLIMWKEQAVQPSFTWNVRLSQCRTSVSSLCFTITFTSYFSPNKALYHFRLAAKAFVTYSSASLFLLDAPVLADTAQQRYNIAHAVAAAQLLAVCTSMGSLTPFTLGVSDQFVPMCLQVHILFKNSSGKTAAGPDCFVHLFLSAGGQEEVWSHSRKSER